MLPFCYPPFNGCFAAFAPPPMSTAALNETTRVKVSPRTDKEEDDEKDLHQAFDPGMLLTAKGSPLSSTDSNPSEKEEINGEGEVKIRCLTQNQQQSTLDAESARMSGKNQLERSSSGSNTPGSEVDNEAVGPTEDENPKDDDLLPLHPDAFDPSRRGVDPRKEVSKEVTFFLDFLLFSSANFLSCFLSQGRLAFQALFSREVLPQSFSPTEGEEEKEHKSAAASPPPEVNPIQPFQVNPVDRISFELGQRRLKPQSTGFKPYKRCSVEAKQTEPPPEDDKCNKRICLEREAST